MGSHERTRAVRFLRDFAVRTAGRTEGFEWGVALFDDTLPRVWDWNLVWVDAVPRSVSAERLTAEVDRLQGGAGLTHRKVVVADERSGERLAPGLRALGWSAKRHQLMAHRRAPDRPSDLSLAREADEPTVRAFCELSLRRDPAGFSEETVHQIAATKRIVATAGARFFAADADGTVASACDLYADGGIAQIEAVLTLEEHRNRGLARAVVLRALAAARASGHDFVFLQAEEGDWPRELYRKLGFDPIGFTHVFLRTPT